MHCESHLTSMRVQFSMAVAGVVFSSILIPPNLAHNCRTDARPCFVPLWQITLTVCVCLWRPGPTRRSQELCVPCNMPVLKILLSAISCRFCGYILCVLSPLPFGPWSAVYLSRFIHACKCFNQLQRGDTALIAAAASGFSDCVRLLLEAGADKDGKYRVRDCDSILASNDFAS